MKQFIDRAFSVFDAFLVFLLLFVVVWCSWATLTGAYYLVLHQDTRVLGPLVYNALMVAGALLVLKERKLGVVIMALAFVVSCCFGYLLRSTGGVWPYELVLNVIVVSGIFLLMFRKKNGLTAWQVLLGK